MTEAGWYWSWLLTLVGVTGFWLTGNRVWWAWYVNVGCQGLWATYSILTEQWGFLVACGVYGFVFGRNALRSTREHREQVRHERAVTGERPPVA